MEFGDFHFDSFDHLYRYFLLNLDHKSSELQYALIE